MYYLLLSLETISEPSMSFNNYIGIGVLICNFEVYLRVLNFTMIGQNTIDFSKLNQGVHGFWLAQLE